MKNIKEALQEQLKNYRDLLDLTRKLEESAAGKDFSAMQPLMLRRGKILDKISSGQNILGQLWSTLSPQERRSSGPDLEAIQKIQGEIAARDRAIGSQCRAAKDEIQKKLGTLIRGRRALHGYLPRGLGIPRYIDKRG